MKPISERACPRCQVPSSMVDHNGNDEGSLNEGDFLICIHCCYVELYDGITFREAGPSDFESLPDVIKKELALTIEAVQYQIWKDQVLENRDVRSEKKHD